MAQGNDCRAHRIDHRRRREPGDRDIDGVTLNRDDSSAFAALLITGSMFLQPAQAQSAPQGSYRSSCTDARVEDHTLTAVCGIAGGREQRTTLTDVDRCVGDIGNDNGTATCNHEHPMAPYREDRR